jgi:hypothetical protein
MENPLPPKRSKLRALVLPLMVGGMVMAAWAAAAERDPVLDVLQARCIQEGMLRGVNGEALKNFVAMCVETRRKAPNRDLQPFSADPGAC